MSRPRDEHSPERVSVLAGERRRREQERAVELRVFHAALHRGDDALPRVGGLDRMFLKDMLSDIGKGGIGNPNPLAPTIPEAVYICFQMTFAIITPALIAGAFAERMKFSALLWFIIFPWITPQLPLDHVMPGG